MHLPSVGIDAIALALPQKFISLDELALARGVPPEKYQTGLGVEKMAIPGFEEDPVALAVNAARQLFRSSGCSPQQIGLCLVGTETPVDYAKPISIYLHRMLGLPSSCRVFETKHACYGGTAGLFTALEWIVSGSAQGRSALVVCTDIACYPLQSPGEPTQGAGAIALLLSANPRLLAIDPASSGVYSHEVYDFWRPLQHKNAIANGPLSIQSYLEALTNAYKNWKERNPQHAPLLRSCYHVPYGKMARKAHQHRLSLEKKNLSGSAHKEEIETSLVFPAQVGNMYTGSLYLALASLLHHEAPLLEGSWIGLFSYGSGCTAEFFAGKVSEQAGSTMKKLHVEYAFRNRQKIDIATYESIRLQAEHKAVPLVAESIPIEADLSQNVVFRGFDQSERRLYQNVPLHTKPANTNR